MNTIKTFFLMMVMSALLLLVGYMLGGPVGIIFALVIAIVFHSPLCHFPRKSELTVQTVRVCG